MGVLITTPVQDILGEGDRGLPPAALLPTASSAGENTESRRAMYSGQDHRTRKCASQDLNPGRWPVGQRCVQRFRVLPQPWVHLQKNVCGGHAFPLFFPLTSKHFCSPNNRGLKPPPLLNVGFWNDSAYPRRQERQEGMLTS